MFQGPLVQPERLHTQPPRRAQVVAAGLLAALGHGAPPLLLALLKPLPRLSQRVLPIPPASALLFLTYPSLPCSLCGLRYLFPK